MFSEKIKDMQFSKSNVKYKDKNIVFNYYYYGKSLDTCIKNEKIYEEEMLTYIYERYGKGGLYLDIGAYCGTHSLFFSQICEANKVYAFEPDHVGFYLLEKNIRENNASNVIAYNIGLGDEERKGIINEESKIIMGSILDKNVPFCEVKKLDNVLPELESIKFIKLDIEGMEINALNGMKNILKKSSNRPAFAIECHTQEHHNKINSFLSNYNYKSIARFNATPTFIFECQNNEIEKY